jgi:uncharacterized membrane protein YjfL (UPF0719 family)
MKAFLTEALLTIGWALVGAVCMAIGFGVFIKVFSWMTPIDEWEEIKKGNIAASIVLAAALVGLAIVLVVAIK